MQVCWFRVIRSYRWVCVVCGQPSFCVGFHGRPPCFVFLWRHSSKALFDSVFISFRHWSSEHYPIILSSCIDRLSFPSFLLLCRSMLFVEIRPRLWYTQTPLWRLTLVRDIRKLGSANLKRSNVSTLQTSSQENLLSVFHCPRSWEASLHLSEGRTHKRSWEEEPRRLAIRRSARAVVLLGYQQTSWVETSRCHSLIG